ncbi:hypothetical protein DEO72_LG9g2935 [Vigna unguiculata]|uniref:Uncharacterized protein n=1 Tax=Vigna unguiculata TaxID=3917 RepID=A0A4D6N280_VIGUN|nr:hypothetical protein DEO72_LG9g2935 [Vigna unguiculata]
MSTPPSREDATTATNPLPVDETRIRSCNTKRDLQNPNQRLSALRNQAALTNHHVAKQMSPVTTLAEAAAMNEEEGGRKPKQWP